MCRNESDSKFELLHGKALSCAAVSGDGCFVVTGSTDMTVRLWKLDVQKPHSATTGASTVSRISAFRNNDLILQV